jgi:hypothetical protein
MSKASQQQQQQQQQQIMAWGGEYDTVPARGARAGLSSLEHDHVPPIMAQEVPSQGGACDAAAYNNHVCLVGQRLA